MSRRSNAPAEAGRATPAPSWEKGAQKSGWGTPHMERAESAIPWVGREGAKAREETGVHIKASEGDSRGQEGPPSLRHVVFVVPMEWLLCATRNPGLGCR